MERPMPIAGNTPRTPAGSLAYVNGVEVWLSGVGEVSLKFLFVSKEQQIRLAPAMIIGPIYLARMLRDICTEVVNDYEMVFGPIKSGSPELSEELFKFNTKLGGTPDAPKTDGEPSS